MMSYVRKIRWLLLMVIVGGWLIIDRADVSAQIIFQFSPTQGVWDATGNYPSDEFDTTNNIDLVQDDKGKITGIGTGTATDSGITVNLVYNFSGAIKTVSDLTRVTLTMKVSGTATDGSGTLPVKGNIRLALDLNRVNNLLIGSGAGNICVEGRCTKVGGPVQFDIPQPMDGSWTLTVDLQSLDNGRIGGTATTTLSNGRAVPFTVTGRSLAQLNLKGPAGTVILQQTAHSLGWVLTKAKLIGQSVPTSP